MKKRGSDQVASGQNAVASPARVNVSPSDADSAKQRVAKWRGQLEVIANRFPYELKSIMSTRRSRFTVEDVYACGTIVGRYAGDPNAVSGDCYRLFVRWQQPSVGCSCARSNGQSPCTHGYGFVAYLLDQLREDAPLSERVGSRRFSVGQPDFNRFRYDETLDAIDRLQRFLPDHPFEPDVQISRNVEITRQRVGWNLSVDADSVVLSITIQSPNKRGNGWSKGRETSLMAIRNEIQRTPGDARALRMITWDLSSRHQIRCIAAVLQLLIGQDNVLLNDKPVELALGEGRLQLVEGETGWSVRPVPEGDGQEMQTRFVFDGRLTIDPSIPRVYVLRTSGLQSNCMDALCDFPAVKQAEHVQHFIDRCWQFQSFVNLLMPPSYAPWRDSPAQPVLMLRLDADGQLDYAIRMRDALGQLHVPGMGPLILTRTVDDRPVQLLRSHAQELQRAEQVAQILELPANTHDAALDFESGLRLIELLQQHSAEIEVLWDPTSESAVRSLGQITNQSIRVTISKKRDWFQLGGQCHLGSTQINLSDVIRSLQDDSKCAGDYVQLGNDSWAQVGQEIRSNLLKLANTVNLERGQMRLDKTAARLMRQLQQHWAIETNKAWQECMERLQAAEMLEPVLPAQLQVNLRDYQVAGFQWMRRLAEWGVGGVLADDMGLGKTVQTLAVLVDRAQIGPTLVIAPTSVGFNWMREIARFAPSLVAHSYRETDRGEMFKKLGPHHIVVCSYGLALRDISKLSKVHWNTLVLDEAQAIKNGNSKTSQAVAEIQAEWKVALTGTPVENHLGELWSLFRIISPGLLGSWDQFRSRFAAPIERYADKRAQQALRERLQPFVLRRTKQEVLHELPARTESNLFVELSDGERKLYDQFRLSVVKQARDIAQQPDTQDQRFKLLALLTRLRQIACHARLVDASWPERSAKLEQLRETLLELREEGHRVLVFSQFVQHLNLIREMLDAEGITYQYLDGSLSAKKRQTAVDAFQNGSATAFLISLKAGGTGLNLTAADYVIHMDPWWNPAVEDQATDRAHRMGQNKPVMVYRMIARATIEEEILRLHQDKRDLVAGILDGTHSAASLSTQELLGLLTEQQSTIMPMDS